MARLSGAERLDGRTIRQLLERRLGKASGISSAESRHTERLSAHRSIVPPQTNGSDGIKSAETVQDRQRRRTTPGAPSSPDNLFSIHSQSIHNPIHKPCSHLHDKRNRRTVGRILVHPVPRKRGYSPTHLPFHKAQRRVPIRTPVTV